MSETKRISINNAISLNVNVEKLIEYLVDTYPTKCLIREIKNRLIENANDLTDSRHQDHLKDLKYFMSILNLEE